MYKRISKASLPALAIGLMLAASGASAHSWHGGWGWGQPMYYPPVIVVSPQPMYEVQPPVTDETIDETHTITHRHYGDDN